MLAAFINKHLIIGGVAVLSVLAFLGLGWWYGVDYAQKSAISYVQYESIVFQKKLFSRHSEDDKPLLAEHESLGFAAAAPKREIVLYANGVFRPSGATISLWLASRVKALQKLERHEQQLWWINEQGQNQKGLGAAQWLIFGTVIDDKKQLFILYNLTGEKAFIHAILKLVYWFIPLIIVTIFGVSWLIFRRFERNLHQINLFLANVRNADALGKDLTEGESPELRQLSKEINIMLNHLKTGIESQEQAVHDFAHAFETPCSIAANTLDEESEKTGSVKLAIQAAKMRNLAKLSKALCQIAAIGVEYKSRTILSLSEPINCFVEFEDISFDDKEIRVTRNLAPACKIIDVNNLTMQVISNLVSNAVKYTARGGHLIITTQKVQEGWTLVMENSPSYRIKSDEQEQLTQPLFRAASVRSQKGYGLGLTFVKKAMEIMNGTSRFEVSGDVFRVILVWPDADHLCCGRKGIVIAKSTS